MLLASVMHHYVFISFCYHEIVFISPSMCSLSSQGRKVTFFVWPVQFPTSSSELFPDFLELDSHKDLSSALYEALQGESDDHISRYQL